MRHQLMAETLTTPGPLPGALRPGGRPSGPERPGRRLRRALLRSPTWGAVEWSSRPKLSPPYSEEIFDKVFTGPFLGGVIRVPLYGRKFLLR